MGFFQQINLSDPCEGDSRIVNWRNLLPKQMVPRRLLHMFLVKFTKTKATAVNFKGYELKAQALGCAVAPGHPSCWCKPIWGSSIPTRV